MSGAAGRPERMLFSGHAVLPKGVALQEHLGIVTCVLEVEMESGRIVDASFSTLTPLTDRFLRELLIGYELRRGFPPLAAEVRRVLHLNSVRAFLKAIEGAFAKFAEVDAARRSVAASI